MQQFVPVCTLDRNDTDTMLAVVDAAISASVYVIPATLQYI